MNKTIEIIRELCCGCGTCQTVCPQTCIKMTMRENGYCRPELNSDDCIDCGLCLEICPVYKYPRFDFHESFSDCGYGCSKDDKFRSDAASGGLLTELLCNLLNTGAIDGVYAVKGFEDGKLPSVVCVDSEQELKKIAGSTYYPVPGNAWLKDLEEREGKYAVIALPCQVQGIRLLQKKKSCYADKIKYIFGLFCNHLPSARATEYMSYVCDTGQLSAVKYRGDGWPGKMKLYGSNCSVALPFRKMWGGGFGLFFYMQACRFCADPFAKLADASFADAYFLQNDEKKMGKGQTFAIVRNQELNSLLDKKTTFTWQTVDYESTCKSSYQALHNRQDISSIQYMLHLKFFRPSVLGLPRFNSLLSLHGIRDLLISFKKGWLAFRDRKIGANCSMWKKKFNQLYKYDVQQIGKNHQKRDGQESGVS